MNLKLTIYKTLIVTGLLMFFLPLTSTLNIAQSLIIGLAISFLLYASDLIIFPRVNVLAATFADIMIVILGLWAGVRFFNGLGLTVPMSLLFTLIIGTGEWFLHRYLRVNAVAE